MNILGKGIAIIIALLPTCGLAAESPEAFLSEILAGDFSGDEVSRREKVIYTDNKPEDVGECGCTVPRESYSVEEDEIGIISRWQLLDTQRPSANHATVRAIFHVLARTELHHMPERMTDRRDTIPLQPAQDKIITYKLKLKKGKWFLVDPPIPMVDINVVINTIKGRMADREERIGNPSFSDDEHALEKSDMVFDVNAISTLDKLSDTDKAAAK